MNNKLVKKLVTVALTGALVLGNALPVLAENPANGSGTAEGTGSSNGHVEQKVVRVTLPTDVGTTFDYVADPEDLIGSTKPSNGTKGKMKDGTEVVPNGSYIYFHNAEVTADDDKGITAVTDGYSDTSNTVRVSNKSSVAINLSVTAAVEANDNNMAIADAASELTTATSTPTVHFDLLTKVKGADNATSTPVVADGDDYKAEIADIAVAGTAANFELTQSGDGTSGKYEYSVKDTVKDKDWTWVDISLKGACSKAETTDELVAPKFELTWSWKDPEAGPQVTFSTAGLITMSNLTAAKNYAHSAVLSYGDNSFELDTDTNLTWGVDNWTAANGGTLTFQLNQAWLSALAGKTATVTVKLSDDSTISATQTFTE